MGEIAEALKRAKAEGRKRVDEAPRESAPAAPAPSAPESTRSQAEHVPAPPAPPPAAERLPTLAERFAKPEALEPRAEASPAPSDVVTFELSPALADIDAHRHLALRVRAELEPRGIRSIAVVSALRNEGKTMTACTIAAALASVMGEHTVALVDLDLRNPSVGRRIGAPLPLGIEEVLERSARLSEVRQVCASPSLDVYVAHTPQRNAHELLRLPSFAETIRELEASYAIVVVDTPPTLLVPDASLILDSVGGCLAVATIAQTKVRRFTEMLESLPADKLIGKILNCVNAPKHRRESYYYYDAEEES